MIGLLTLAEAAIKLGVNKMTLRRWDKKGVLKAIRINSRGDRRYRQEELDNFMDIVICKKCENQVPNSEFCLHCGNPINE